MKLKFALEKIHLANLTQEEDLINNHFEKQIKKGVEYLNRTGFFSLKELGESEVFRYVKIGFNLSSYESTCGLFQGKDTKTKQEVEHIQIGDNLLGIYGLINEVDFPSFLPDKTRDSQYSSRSFSFYKGLGDHFGFSLDFSHIYNQILFIDDSKYWIKQTEKKKEILKGLRNFAPEIKAQYQMLEEMLEEIYKSGEPTKLVRAHFNVVFWEKNKQRFDINANQLSSVCKDLDLHINRFKGPELSHLFFNSHFVSVSNFSNHHLSVLPLDTALCLLSHVTNYKSDPTGVLFNDRLSNIPIVKDVWDASKKRIKARNFAIFAPTGEGKSVLANHLIRQFLDQGYKVVIIDLGGSYEKLCHLYSEKSLYLKFENSTPLGINPFALDSIEELTPSKLESLSEFIFLHIKRDQRPSQNHRVSLIKILNIYYKRVFENKYPPSFPNFIYFVNANTQEICKEGRFSPDEFNFREFAHLSSEFIEGGVFSFLYSNSNHLGGDVPQLENDVHFGSHFFQDVNFSQKQLIVADLDAIKDNALLLSIYLKSLNDAIDNNIWQDKTQKGIVLYDEFAKSLQFENVLNQVVYYAQAIRKQNGALGIILQSINQLPDKQEVRAMIENIQVIYSLKNQAGYKDILERLNLNEHQHYQLQSLNNDFSGKRKYSEFWLRLGDQSNVYRLELPQEALYAYLTEGEENQKILELFKETGDMQKAIEMYCSKGEIKK